MHWAFVDYENVGSLEALKITDYEKIFVFCGPRNTRIKFGSIPSDGFCSIEIIGVTTMGSNNLDFHIAFHIGRFHEIADKNIAFHVISNDSGFNGLVNHLKKIGRKCKKISTNAPRVAETKLPELSECASFILDKLKLNARARPRIQPMFLNWIKSHCQGLANPPEPQAIFDELVKANIVLVSESNITYELGR